MSLSQSMWDLLGDVDYAEYDLALGLSGAAGASVASAPRTLSTVVEVEVTMEDGEGEEAEPLVPSKPICSIGNPLVLRPTTVPSLAVRLSQTRAPTPQPDATQGSSSLWACFEAPSGEDLEELEMEEVENCTATQTVEPVSATQVDPAAGETTPLGRSFVSTTSNATTVPCTSQQPVPRFLATLRSAATGSSASSGTKRALPSAESSSASIKRARIDTVPAGNPFLASSSSIPEVDPNYVLVAHSAVHQFALDTRKLSWGVLWEVGRWITKRGFKWEDLTMEIMDQLKGPNAEAAPKVSKLLRGADAEVGPLDDMYAKHYQMEIAKKLPFAELDIEDDLLKQDSPVRLGLGGDGYFGGKVVQTIRLELTEKAKKLTGEVLRKLPPDQKFEMIMEAQELGRSTRFHRYYGSRRLITVSISKYAMNGDGQQLVDYLCKGFVLFGRVYRAITAKDKSVYLIETKENYGRILFDDIDAHLLTFEEFVSWHNELEPNSNQPMAKYGSRFHLGLSTTIPSVSFKREHIFREPDVISPAWTSDAKPPSEMIMTDGCGFMNHSAARAIAEQFQLRGLPCAVQARLGGSKGMFMLKPGRDDPNDPPMAWWRPSQLKVVWPENLDPSKLILDLVRLPRVTCPARLSAETIINLAYNGVSHSVFEELMKEGLKKEVALLTTWSNAPGGAAALWDAVFRSGNVFPERMKREDSVSARARNYGEAGDDGDDNGDDEEAMNETKAARWWPDEISGCPATLHETVCDLLQAGFLPDTHSILHTKLEQVVKMAVSAYVRRYKIVIQESATAFILPDPIVDGVLAPDEIFFQFSRPPIDPVTGREIDVLTGEVLVGRHPMKLPTDIRKLRAVDVPALREYKDVVIFSVQGQQSAASILSGGDYDGDTVSVIWEKRIVDQFKNAPLHLADPPKGLRDEFEERNERVDDFIERVRDLSVEDRRKELQKVLLGALVDSSIVGQYSNFHDMAIYAHGLDHPITTRLAHIFCQQLDGAKSGLRVKESIRKKDMGCWTKYQELGWKNHDNEQDYSGDNRDPLARPKKLRNFVMDDLKTVGILESNRHMEMYRGLKPRQWTADEHLVEPYKEAVERAKEVKEKLGLNQMEEELKRLKSEVERVQLLHRENIAGEGINSPRKRPGPNRQLSFTHKDIQTRQDTFRKLSAAFHAPSDYKYLMFSAVDIKRIKASYAYLLTFQEGGAKMRFAWDVAFRNLCEIKAAKLGPYSTVTNSIHNKMTIPSKALISKQ